MTGVSMFTIRSKEYGFKHTIESWGEYGVVCPTLCTTNGSAYYLAKVIASRPNFYEVVEGGGRWSLNDEKVLAEEMLKAHKSILEKNFCPTKMGSEVGTVKLTDPEIKDDGAYDCDVYRAGPVGSYIAIANRNGDAWIGIGETMNEAVDNLDDTPIEAAGLHWRERVWEWYMRRDDDPVAWDKRILVYDCDE